MCTHAFVIGHTGVMLGSNAELMTALGISPARVGPFLIDLALSSLQKSCAILACFPLSQSALTTPAPPVVVSSEPLVPLADTAHAPPSLPLAPQQPSLSHPPPVSSPANAVPLLTQQPSQLSHVPPMSSFTHASSLITAQSPTSLPTLLTLQPPSPHVE